MTTTTMPGGLFASPALAGRRGPGDTNASESGLREYRHLAAVRIEQSRVGGESARGKPPVVSARLLVAMQWTMFAMCALRCLHVV